MNHHLEIFSVPERVIDDRAAGVGQTGLRALDTVIGNSIVVGVDCADA